MNNTKKCPHGFELGPNGEHIIPSNKAIPIQEAAKLYNKEPPVIVHKAPTKKEKELQQSIKEWDKFFADNQGKIKRDFPKNIFEI